MKTQGTPISPTNDAAVYSWAKQAMVDYSRTITPTLINDLRLNYTRGRFSNTAGVNYDANSGQNLNTLLGLPNITKGGVPGFNTLFPGSSLGGGGSTATGFGSGGSTEEEDREERYAVTDIVYKNRGNMSLTFGVDVSHSLQNVIPALRRARRRLHFQQHSDRFQRRIHGHRRQSLGQLSARRAQRQRDPAQRRGAVLLPLECRRGLHPERLEDHARI